MIVRERERVSERERERERERESKRETEDILQFHCERDVSVAPSRISNLNHSFVEEWSSSH